MGAAGAVAPPAQAPLFVGRDEELSRLHDALRRASAGPAVLAPAAAPLPVREQ